MIGVNDDDGDFQDRVLNLQVSLNRSLLPPSFKTWFWVPANSFPRSISPIFGPVHLLVDFQAFQGLLYFLVPSSGCLLFLYI